MRDPLIIIFGADGLLGNALIREAQTRRLEHYRHGRDVDITDDGAVALALSPARDEPFVVINAAAWTHMDACEQNPDRAFATNAWGPRVLAQRCSIGDARFVHVSTGAVFDGRVSDSFARIFSHPGFDEFDRVSPVSVYAQTKWAGEELVREVEPRALIIRLGHLYGPGGRNGLSAVRKRLLDGERFTINNHCRISPTYVGDAARVILDAVQADIYGTTLHVAPAGSTTASGFAHRMQKLLDKKELVDGDSLNYPQGQDGLGQKVLGVSGPVLAKDLAWRPHFQLIRSSTLALRGLRPIGTWEEGLDRYLAAEASS